MTQTDSDRVGSRKVPPPYTRLKPIKAHSSLHHFYRCLTPIELRTTTNLEAKEF